MHALTGACIVSVVEKDALHNSVYIHARIALQCKQYAKLLQTALHCTALSSDMLCALLKTNAGGCSVPQHILLLHLCPITLLVYLCEAVVVHWVTPKTALSTCALRIHYISVLRSMA